MVNIDKILLGNYKLESAGACNIVINSKILQKKGKQIFVKIEKGNVIYYYKDSEKVGNISKKVELQNYGDTIQSMLESDVFCGVQAFRIPADEYSLSVKVDPSLHLIFIETPLYSAIRKLLTNRPYSLRKIRLSSGAETYDLSPEEISRYVEAFKENACVNYMHVVYSTRFLNKISKMKGGSFYGLLKVFIPILIETEYLYNPLTDNPDFDFRETSLYKKAVEMDRVKEVLPGGALKATLMTHREICEAIGMTRFMRFTPTFLYKFMIGSFYTGKGLFPNTAVKVYALPEDYFLPQKLKRAYRPEDFLSCLQEFKELLDRSKANGDTEKAKEYEELIGYLRNYNEVDTLRWHISQDFSKLTRFGISALDEKITQTEMYDYLRVAKFQ